MVKQKKKKMKRVKPDDYFTWGPFEMARFGKTTIVKSHLTAEQLAEAQAKMAERFPTLVAEMDALVLSIAHQVARLPPTVLVDYVQSLIASVEPDTYAEDVSEDDWKKLKADVADLFHRLTIEYEMCLTGYRINSSPALFALDGDASGACSTPRAPRSPHGHGIAELG